MIYRRVRNIRSDNTGVSNVVSLILIAAIMISLMGMVFTTYLPAWGKDIEAQTLNNVMDSFMDLKSGVDTLAVSGDPGTSLTTKMTLGSNGGPMFGFGRCTGSLDMRMDDGLLEVADVTSGGNIIYAQSRGNVVYTSSNTYVEEQIITLEAGAIIRDQSGIPVLKGQPNLVINRDPNTEETTIYVMLITLEGETRSDSGTGSYMIKTTLLSEQTTYYPMGSRDMNNVITDRSDIRLSITTDHSSLWTDIFTYMAVGEGLLEDVGTDGYSGGIAPEYLIDSTTIPGTVTMTLYGMVGDLVLKSTVFELETI